jgi:hypothetical protein
MLADLGIASGVPFIDATDRRDDLPGRAIAALERILIDEGLLHRVEGAAPIGEPLDRRHCAIIVRRPTSPAQFNGTVLVEWVNVTSGYNNDALFRS